MSCFRAERLNLRCCRSLDNLRSISVQGAAVTDDLLCEHAPSHGDQHMWISSDMQASSSACAHCPRLSLGLSSYCLMCSCRPALPPQTVLCCPLSPARRAALGRRHHKHRGSCPWEMHFADSPVAARIWCNGSRACQACIISCIHARPHQACSYACILLWGTDVRALSEIFWARNPLQSVTICINAAVGTMLLFAAPIYFSGRNNQHYTRLDL